MAINTNIVTVVMPEDRLVETGTGCSFNMGTLCSESDRWRENPRFEVRPMSDIWKTLTYLHDYNHF